MTGQVLICPEPVQVLDANDGDRLSFPLTNYGVQPITVVGVRSSCPCMRPENLPLVIPANRSAPITVRHTALCDTLRSAPTAVLLKTSIWNYLQTNQSLA